MRPFLRIKETLTALSREVLYGRPHLLPIPKTTVQQIQDETPSPHTHTHFSSTTKRFQEPALIPRQRQKPLRYMDILDEQNLDRDRSLNSTKNRLHDFMNTNEFEPQLASSRTGQTVRKRDTWCGRRKHVPLPVQEKMKRPHIKTPTSAKATIDKNTIMTTKYKIPPQSQSPNKMFETKKEATDHRARCDPTLYLITCCRASL